MPTDLSLLLTGSNYPCLELIFMVPKVFEPLKFDCILCFPLTRTTLGLEIRDNTESKDSVLQTYLIVFSSVALHPHLRLKSYPTDRRRDIQRESSTLRGMNLHLPDTF